MKINYILLELYYFYLKNNLETEKTLVFSALHAVHVNTLYNFFQGSHICHSLSRTTYILLVCIS